MEQLNDTKSRYCLREKERNLRGKIRKKYRENTHVYVRFSKTHLQKMILCVLFHVSKKSHQDHVLSLHCI